MSIVDGDKKNKGKFLHLGIELQNDAFVDLGLHLHLERQTPLLHLPNQMLDFFLLDFEAPLQVQTSCSESIHLCHQLLLHPQHSSRNESPWERPFLQRQPFLP